MMMNSLSVGDKMEKGREDRGRGGWMRMRAGMLDWIG